MPKTLTETNDADVFDDPIVVPDGDDDMDEHAQDLERFAQKLTDRSRHLFARTGKLAGTNAWTGANVFEGATEVRTQLFIDPDASDSAGIHVDRTGGDYQEVLSARAGTGGNDRVRIYSGSNGDTQGALYFVVNARYVASGDAAGWNQIDRTKPSCAVILRNQDVRVVGKAAGVTPHPWSSWQQTTIADFDAELVSEVVRMARSYVAPLSDTDRAHADYATRFGGYRYTAPMDRTSPIPLGLLWGNKAHNSSGHVFRRATTPGEDNAIWIPIPCPPHSAFRQVHVHFHQLQGTGGSTSEPDRFQLYKREHAGAWAAVGSYEAPVTTTGEVTANLHTSGAQLVLDREEWAYRWKVVTGDGAASENRIIGVSLDWTDYGPANRIG